MQLTLEEFEGINAYISRSIGNTLSESGNGLHFHDEELLQIDEMLQVPELKRFVTRTGKINHLLDQCLRLLPEEINDLKATVENTLLEVVRLRETCKGEEETNG